MTTLSDIEKRCAGYRRDHDVLAAELQTLEDAIMALKRQHLPAIREAYAELAAAETLLRDDLETGKALFEKPRTRVLHGLKVGWKKRKGKLVIDDPGAVIKRIRARMPELADTLIKKNEAPIKNAIEGLDTKALKALGVRVECAGDAQVLTAVDSAIERLIKNLLGDFRREIEADRQSAKEAA